MRTLLIIAGLAALAGCADAPGDRPAHQSDFDKVAKDCAARGGVLVPLGGANHGNPALDNACEFRGQSPKDPRG